MTIKHKSIDTNYFEDEIEKYFKENNIRKVHIINITQNNGFTTVWYRDE